MKRREYKVANNFININNRKALVQGEKFLVKNQLIRAKLAPQKDCNQAEVLSASQSFEILLWWNLINLGKVA